MKIYGFSAEMHGSASCIYGSASGYLLPRAETTAAASRSPSGLPGFSSAFAIVLGAIPKRVAASRWGSFPPLRHRE